jgi:hypothetical protein
MEVVMITAREVTEVPMHELSGVDLDAVSGGFLDFGNIVIQPNIGVQIGLSLFSLASIQQLLGQGNNSSI